MKEKLLSFLKKVRNFFIEPIISNQQNLTNTKQTQLILSLQYKEMLHNGVPLPSFDEVGFRVYSENDEDGILLYIFSLIGTTNKKVIDIGAASINISNTANLIINHGWIGLLVDGNEAAINSTREFYLKCSDTRNYPPTVISSWVTAENVNSIILKNGFSGEVDLLSIDIDGIDYWVWKAIDCISPRVVILEYQAIWGFDKSVSIPYTPDFKAQYQDRFGIYSGASLSAFVKLGKEKGYRLVGCHRYGYNAFFVRADVGENILPEIPISTCFTHPFTKWANEELLPKVIEREWVEI